MPRMQDKLQAGTRFLFRCGVCELFRADISFYRDVPCVRVYSLIPLLVLCGSCNYCTIVTDAPRLPVFPPDVVHVVRNLYQKMKAERILTFSTLLILVAGGLC